ncbi:MAG: O-antigen ligase family protein [Candidatus Doudnabacteria bacterium]|nr:O-antigen ligase family protein [Candidatus Doudnabacteria bacterium]
MLNILKKIPRLPFREDTVFSLFALLFLTLPLFFNWNLNEKFETFKFALWLVLGGIIFLAVIIKNTVRVPKGVLGYSLFVWILLAILATVFSISPQTSFFGFYPRFTSGFLFYFLWAMTFVFLLSSTNTQKQQVLFRITYFDAVFIAIVGLLQSFGVGYYEGVGQAAISRAPSLLGNPNFSSMFVVCALPFWLPLYFGAKSFSSKVYYTVGAFLLLWSAVNFSSRGAWIGLITGLLASLVFTFAFKFSKSVKLGAASALLGSIFVMAVFLQVARPEGISSILSFSDQSLTSRFFSWEVAARAASKFPFFGYGPGTLQIFYEKFRDSGINGQAGIFDDAHNIFLQMGATTGLPFVLIFLTICLLALWRGVKSLKENNSDLWGLANLVALVIWLTTSCFNPVSTANYLLLLGILASMLFSKTEFVNLNLRTALKYPLACIAVLISLYGVVFLFSEFLFFKAKTSFVGQSFISSRKYVTFANRINPFNQTYYLYQVANEVIANPKYLDLNSRIDKVIGMERESARSYVMAANLSYLTYDMTNESRYLNQAILFMNQSLVIDRYSPSRYVHTAFYLAEAGQFELAREYLKSSLALDSNNLSAWMLLARIYQLENRPAQLKYALNEAFKLKPDEVYLKQLSQSAQDPSLIKKLVIPAYINVLQIEP